MRETSSPLSIAVGAALCLTLLAVQPASADTGIFGSYIVLNINGGGSTFYDLSSATANPDFQGANLGTFNPSAGNTLVLNGGEVDTFKNGNTGGNTGTNVTGATTDYDIHLTSLGQTPFTALNLPFNSNLANPGDQKWQLTSQTTNLLAGLSPGTYKFEVFSTENYDNGSGGGAGTVYASNNANNYVATFTVVPEPSTILSTAFGVCALGLMMWRRLGMLARVCS